MQEELDLSGESGRDRKVGGISQKEGISVNLTSSLDLPDLSGRPGDLPALLGPT
jgi:hypothetical protein